MARIGFIVSLAMVTLLGAGCVDQKKHDALVKEHETLNEQFVVVQEKNQRLMEEKLAIEAQFLEIVAQTDFRNRERRFLRSETLRGKLQILNRNLTNGVEVNFSH